MDAYVSKPLQPAEVFATIEASRADRWTRGPEPTRDALLRPAASSTRPRCGRTQRTTRPDPAPHRDLRGGQQEDARGDPRWHRRSHSRRRHARRHRLKGSLSTLGAETAAELAHLLELLGTDGNLAGAEDALARLQDELGLLDVELAAVREDALARRS